MCYIGTEPTGNHRCNLQCDEETVREVREIVNGDLKINGLIRCECGQWCFMYVKYPEFKNK